MLVAGEKVSFTVVFFGDVVSSPGRSAVKRVLPKLKAERSIDLVVINAENASGGRGLDPRAADELRTAGADVLTLGDHAFQLKESLGWLGRNGSWVVRPLNYPAEVPGVGSLVVERNGVRVRIVNLLGRTFISAPLECPFAALDKILTLPEQVDITLVDLHAEATSEKYTMLRAFDGRVQGIVGTHTHVQTADEQVTTAGTAYITDAGMTGCGDGVIGMCSQVAIKRFRTGLPEGYRVQEGEGKCRGVIITFSVPLRRATAIERVVF
jgi:2',3'-cyclic-nucleotide 2'-phosphodiesterase